MTIRTGHPFADPQDDPVRRFRGRVGGVVSLWTSGAEAARAGLTVTSFMVARGEPARVLALIDPDSELAVTALDTGTAVVQLLEWEHRDLAEVFGGLMPAPGGAFTRGVWEQSRWGPVLGTAAAWAGLRVLPDPVEVGWSLLLDGVVEEVVLRDSPAPLVHRRGRYVRPAQ